MASKKREKLNVGNRPRAATTREQSVRRASDGRIVESVKISDPAARRDVAALRRELTSDPRRAEAFLREAGIITPTGRLARRFGG